MTTNKTSDKERTKTRVAVYLIGVRGNTVLLGKRHNVSHMNGYWSLPAGHAYEHEQSSQAMLREALEECDLHLKPKELKLIGAMHHNSPPFDYINFIYAVDLTKHEPKNLEPNKCAALVFHPMDNLPEPMAPYIKEIITKSAPGKLWISEFGWDI